MGKKEQTQNTPKGYEIPILKKEGFMENLKKISKSSRPSPAYPLDSSCSS